MFNLADYYADYYAILNLTDPEWANFLFAVFITACSAIGAGFGWFLRFLNHKIADIEREITQLELTVQREISDESARLLTEIKYNIKEYNSLLKDDIKNLHHLISNIEIRLDDRSKYARAKWQSYHHTLMNIINYLEKKHGFIPRETPLDGFDNTLFNEGTDDITEIY
jgi:hypothetical protein